MFCHRIRHTGLFASQSRKTNIDQIRQQLRHPYEPSETVQQQSEAAGSTAELKQNTCRCCGGNLIIIETFERGQQPKYWPPPNWKNT
jgi:hypothetical protein